MLKVIKNIRKIDNAKLLLISNDEKTVKEINKIFEGCYIADSLRATLDLIAEKPFDSIIIDSELKQTSLYEICSELLNIVPSIPKIVILANDKEEDIITSINAGAYTILSKPLKVMDLKFSILMSLNQTRRGDKIEFDHGVYYDEYRDQFFKAGGVLIDFTRLEKGFLKLLIAKRTDVVDYDTIKDVVWKGKDMSIYTMRNIVNKIRQKTYYEIIKNQSNRGYTLDIKSR